MNNAQSRGLAALVIGVAATIGVIVLQLLLPFAFDFVTTLGVYVLGVLVGKEVAAKKP